MTINQALEASCLYESGTPRFFHWRRARLSGNVDAKCSVNAKKLIPGLVLIVI
jgi:hypothetical protein